MKPVYTGSRHMMPLSKKKKRIFWASLSGCMQIKRRKRVSQRSNNETVSISKNVIRCIKPKPLTYHGRVYSYPPTVPPVRFSPPAGKALRPCSTTSNAPKTKRIPTLVESSNTTQHKKSPMVRACPHRGDF